MLRKLLISTMFMALPVAALANGGTYQPNSLKDNYQGFQVGAALGSQAVTVNESVTLKAGNTVLEAGSIDSGSIDFAAQGIVGYNYVFNPNWLAGVEFEYSHNWAEAGGQTQTGTFQTEVKDLYAGLVRVGYANTANNVFFLAAGPVWATVEHSGSNAIFGASTSWDETKFGWEVKGGAEQALTSQWHVREQVAYYHINDVSWQGTNGRVTGNIDLEPRVLSGTFALLYQFNW